MQKRINVKSLAILLASGAVLCSGAHFLHGYQVRSNAGILLAQADRAEQEGRLDVATSYLARYVTLAPADIDARAKYALLIANPKKANEPKALLQAFLVLSRTVQLAPDRDDVRRQLVHIAMNPRLRRYTDAAAHLDKLPAKGVLLGLRAVCMEEMGNYRDARLYYEKALTAAPSELDNFVRLASLLRNNADAVRRDKKADVVRKDEKDAKEDTLKVADDVITAMIAANPRNADAYLIRARYRQQTASPVADRDQLRAEVEADLREAQRLTPDAIDVILAIAELERDRGKPTAARDLLCVGIKRYPKEWSLVQALSRVEVLDDKLDAAIAVLRDGLKAMPDQADLLWNYAHLLIRKQQDAEAAEVISRLGKIGMPRPELDYLQARIHFNHQQWLKTTRTLEHVYPLFRRNHDQRKDWFSFNLALECSLMLGICYEQLGDPYRAATAYGRVVAHDPLSIAGRHGQARMSWALGKFDSAEQVYRHLLGQRVVPPAVWVELAQVLIARNQQSQRPDWNRVLQVVAEAEKQPEKSRPSSVTLAVLRAEVMAARNDYDAARRHLEKAADNKQTRPAEVWVGLAGVELRRGNIDEAVAVLDEAVKYVGDHVELRLARARLWARRGGSGAAKALAALGAGIERFGDADQLRLLRVLAEAHGETGDHAAAMRLWRQVAERRENDLGSRFTLFELAIAAGNETAMRQLTEAIREIEGEQEGMLWRFCLACRRIWQAEHGDKTGLVEAANLLKMVGDRRPAWARVPLAQAEIDNLQGRPDAAVANYKRAVQLGEQRPAIIKQLVRFLTDQGHHLAAEEMILKLRAPAPGLLSGVERPAAEVALFKRDYGKALELARAAVPPDSKDYRDHIWLGRVLWATGMVKEAEASLRRALVLAHDVPEPWVALVQHLVRTNDKSQAEAVIHQAEQKLPMGAAMLDMAQCYDMVGKTERARELYEAAFAARPQDVAVLRAMVIHYLRSNRPDDAKVHLHTILRLKNCPASDVAWANRWLAMATAAGGGNQNSLAALSLLGVTSDETPVVPPTAANGDDVRAKIAILANQPGVRKRRQAIALLESLVQAQRITTDEQFVLAKLYDSVGEWRQTRGLMTDLLSAIADKHQNAANLAEKAAWQNRYATYLAFYCGKLVGREELREALLWQAKLEQLEPHSARNWDIKARLLAKQHKAAAAVPALRKLVDHNPATRVAIAGLLEQIGEISAAEEMFVKHMAVAKEPERLLTAALFFGRQNRTANALDLCEQAWQTCKPDAVAAVSVAVLYRAKSAEAHCQRVVDRLQAAIAAHPDTATFLTNLAAVRRLQGQHQEATELLRQAAERDKSDSLVRNNLAWLYALQGKADEALSVISDAIALRGEQANLLDTRAVAFIAKGKHALAVKDLQEVIAESPTASRYFHLAQAQLGTRNLVAARDAFERGKALGLSESTVDQLERGAFRQLLVQLDKR